MIRIIKKSVYFLTISFLVLLCSCGPEEPKRIIENPIEIEYEFPLKITEMIPSSSIALPDGLSFEGHIINSTSQLLEVVPSSVIREDSRYMDVDFNNNSILSLRYRVFYDVMDVETKLVNIDGNVVVKQLIYVSGPLVTDGYFVMSNFISEKLPESGNLVLQQSFSYE